jgi:hypothetical protein
MGIDILPDELLGYIWAIVDDDRSGPETSHILAAVCHRWRRLALVTGQLWAKLFIAQEHGPLSSELKMRLERTKGAPLTIRFVRTSPEVLSELGTRMEQWRNVWIGVESYEQVLTFLSELAIREPEKIPMPHVIEATLDLTFTWMDMHPSFSSLNSRIWPRLKTLNITSHSLSPWLGLIPPTVTAVSIISARMRISEFQVLAQKCPKLSTLHLSINKLEFPTSNFELSPLPELKEITLSGAGRQTILLVLSACAPRLRSLVWRPRSIGSTFSSRFQSSRTTGFTRLELDMGLRIGTFHIFGEAPLLFSICPLLEDLVIRGATTRKNPRKDATLNALQDRKSENMKELMREVLQCLTGTEQYCPSLSVVELHYMPVDKSHVPFLANRLALTALGFRTNKARLVLSGCIGITLEDCTSLGALSVPVDFE